MRWKVAVLSMGAVVLVCASGALAADRLVPSVYPTIQAGIDAALPGDTVIVAPCTYTGPDNRDLDFKGKAITVRSENPDDPCVVAATVIDCENDGRGFFFWTGEGPGSVVGGLTIRNGQTGWYGGGIVCTNGSSPTIEKCVISDCRVNEYQDWSYPELPGWGGGIGCLEDSHPTIRDCMVLRNEVFGTYEVDQPGPEAYGGGIYCDSQSSAEVKNCLIAGNLCFGGASYEGSPGRPRPKGGDAVGGGVYFAGAGTIENCTIGDNQVIGGEGDPDGDVSGGGLYGTAATTVRDCIIWRNDSSQVAGNPVISYSDIQGGWAGTGNISLDPLFISGAGGDYYLSQVAAGQALDSPCVDAGSDTAASLGMDIYTTRTDQLRDLGMVDMGYHYPLIESADIDLDGDVDFKDYVILADQWQGLSGVPSADIAPPGGDGIVDGKDLGLLGRNWLWGK